MTFKFADVGKALVDSARIILESEFPRATGDSADAIHTHTVVDRRIVWGVQTPLYVATWTVLKTSVPSTQILLYIALSVCRVLKKSLKRIETTSNSCSVSIETRCPPF